MSPGYIVVAGAPAGWGVPLSGDRQLRTVEDRGGAIAEASAAGYQVAGEGPLSAVAGVLADQIADPGLRLWAYLAGSPPARAELVDFTSAAQMRVALQPSLTRDLHCRIVRVDHLSPGGAPLDYVGEKFAGELVIREDRVWAEGAFGPTGRTDVLTAYASDGTVAETWTRAHVYVGDESTGKGQERRNRNIRRLSSWVGTAAAATLGNDPVAGVEAATQWAISLQEPFWRFRELAKPADLIAAVEAGNEGWWAVPCAALGVDPTALLDLAGDAPLSPAATVRDAVIASLSTWAPSWL